MTHLARVKVKTVAGGLLPAVKAAGHDVLQAGGGEGLVSGQGGEVGGPGGGQHRLVLGLLVSPDLYFSKQLTSLTRHYKYGVILSCYLMWTRLYQRRWMWRQTL